MEKIIEIRDWKIEWSMSGVGCNVEIGRVVVGKAVGRLHYPPHKSGDLREMRMEKTGNYEKSPV